MATHADTATPVHDHDHHDDHGGQVHAHIGSLPTYVGIFVTLLMLTALTVAVSYVHLGPANLAVAVVIASIKASLVILFFMHLKDDSRFNAIILVVSLLFIGVFFAYTVNDTGHRGEVDETNGTTVLPDSGKRAPGGLMDPAAAQQGTPPSTMH